MMNCIGYDESTSNEVNQHNDGAQDQTDICISDFEIWYIWTFCISKAYAMVNGSGPYEPNLNKKCFYIHPK